MVVLVLCNSVAGKRKKIENFVKTYSLSRYGELPSSFTINEMNLSARAAGDKNKEK